MCYVKTCAFCICRTNTNILHKNRLGSYFYQSSCYRPKRSFGQGNIFIGVCQEFCSQGGGGMVSQHALQVSPRVGIPACFASQSRGEGGSPNLGGGAG